MKKIKVFLNFGGFGREFIVLWMIEYYLLVYVDLGSFLYSGGMLYIVSVSMLFLKEYLNLLIWSFILGKFVYFV